MTKQERQRLDAFERELGALRIAVQLLLQREVDRAPVELPATGPAPVSWPTVQDPAARTIDPQLAMINAAGAERRGEARRLSRDAGPEGTS